MIEIVEILARLVFIAVFLFVAAGMLRRGDGFSRLCGLFRASDCEGAARLEQAVERRERLERIPSMAISRTVAVVSIGCAIVSSFAPFGAVALSYAFMCLVWALLFAYAVLQVRPGPGRRVAVLSARDEKGGVPSYVFAATAAATVMPLVLIGDSPIAALLVTGAGIVAALAAHGVATMPALLSGEDNEIEIALDDRLRASRTAQLLSLAVVPGFVFICLSFVDSPLKAAACAISFIGCLVTGLWVWRTIRPKPLDPLLS